MKPLFDFLLKMCIFSLIFWSALIISGYSDSPHLGSIALAWGLMTVNAVLGYAAFEYAYGKDSTAFFTMVFGGMGLRLLVLMTVVALLIRFEAVALQEFGLTLFLCYFCITPIEVLGYVRKNSYEKLAKAATLHTAGATVEVAGKK